MHYLPVISNLFVEFLWELTYSCRDNFLGVPLYLWDTTWRFIPITCTDSLSLMVLAWEISRFLISLIAVTSDLYPYGRSLDPFTFPACYRFLRFRIASRGMSFKVARFLHLGLPFCVSIPKTPNSLIFPLLWTRYLLLLQASKSPKVEHPVDCVVTSFTPKHNPYPIGGRTTFCSDFHPRWDT